MGLLVYFLCGLTSFACMFLLIRAYRSARNRLVFWSAACFGFLTLNNIFLFIHMATPPDIDMSLLRIFSLTIAGVVMLYGLIWDTV
jgi:hypothetical protein